jgi:23S rRNA G2445 N2-methylase RlmL
MNHRARSQLFDPELFAHGRLLYRYPGSDASRFSPRLAYRLLGDIAPAANNCVLWDPFCGSGLIVTIARAFFADRFHTIIASDIEPEAVDCCRRNLRIVSDPRAAARRLTQAQGLQRRNAKSLQRWGGVAAYLEALMPRIENEAGAPPSLQAFVASAFDLPRQAEGTVHFIGDLPYGRSSRLRGHGDIPALLDAIATTYPGASMSFVMTEDAARDVLRNSKHIKAEQRSCRNRRAIVSATAR